MGGKPFNGAAELLRQGDEFMRLLIEKSALLKSLQHVTSVVERRNTIPILANVSLRAEKRRAASESHRPRY